ncbi:MAG: 16S rRNA (cytidine(1402)-2'-O)-methyltransferase [Deltaproteobacteria bacterium]|nr:16S rRNA (cytidine(1402)-2'-O)-methyltransferase [Deltaproteobacteria bacterium]
MMYIVATPIGHLEDMTPRARQILASVDIIAAEDTRQTRKLLTHFGIHGKRLVSYHNHGEAERARALVAELVETGKSLALVTDAGTPCISDPGYRIVAEAHAAGLKVHPIPGASALTALVSASGLPSDRVLFIGFLPTRVGALEEEIASWRSMRAAVVFFESTRRLARTLAAVRAVYPQARVVIGRELTKLYEEIVNLEIDQVNDWIAGHATLKGEVSVMVHPGASAEPDDGTALVDVESAARREFAKGATLKDLMRKYQDSGLKRSELYQTLLRAKNDD